MRSSGTLVRSRMARRRSVKRNRDTAAFTSEGRPQIASPLAEVDAAQHQFLVAIGHQLIDVAQHFSQRKRATASAHKRNHAERTAIVAAILHLEVWTCLFVVRVKDRRGHQHGVSKYIFHNHPGSIHRTLCGWCRIVSDGLRRRCVQNRVQRDEATACRDFCQPMFVRIADHQRDALDRRDLFRCALRIASCNKDASRWIGSVNAPNG